MGIQLQLMPKQGTGSEKISPDHNAQFSPVQSITKPIQLSSHNTQTYNNLQKLSY